jgi:hypothetical protein
MKKTSFILHMDALSVLDELTNEQSGILFKAIRDFNSGKEPELDFAMKMCFIPFKNQFTRDFEKYEVKCEKNRENGKFGGRPKKTESEKTDMVILKPKETKANPKNHDSDNDSDNDKDNDKENDKIVFEIFWNVFDKKIDKVKCFKIWKKILKCERTFVQEQARKYVLTTPDVKFRKNPLTWLNGECWNDEIQEMKVVSTKYIPTL